MVKWVAKSTPIPIDIAPIVAVTMLTAKPNTYMKAYNHITTRPIGMMVTNPYGRERMATVATIRSKVAAIRAAASQ